MHIDNYKEPRIYRGDKEWFVEFYYRNPNTDKWDRFRIRGKMNYEKDLDKRNRLATELCHGILKDLKAGKKPAKYVLRKTNDITLLEALQARANVDKVNKSVDTFRNYTLGIRRMKDFLIKRNQPDLLLQQFDGDSAELFKEWLIRDCKLSNVSVNCTIQPLKSFLEHYYDKGKIVRNPFYTVAYLPKHRGSTFIAFTAEEKKRISKHLKEHHPELYLFANIIYSCYIRPKEICGLMPKDIDLQSGFIQVRRENSKVAHTSYRQIVPELKKLLIEYNISALPQNGLIFEKIYGRGPDLRKRRKLVSELWHKVVMKELKIKKEMYGLKHTGNIDYLQSLPNIGEANLLWLKQQNDHTTLETTQKYIRDLGIYKMGKENFYQFGIL